MENLIIRMFPISGIKKCPSNAITQFSLQRYCSTKREDIMTKDKKRHPYRKIHPWNSIEKFSKSLVKGVIHNEDGLVAINKPYGISGKKTEQKGEPITGIVKQVNYTLEDALPQIACELGYSKLQLVKTPEKFTSGVTILAATQKVENAVKYALERAQGMRIVPNTYWAVTTRVPNEIKGEKTLAMRMKQGPNQGKKLPVIVETWSRNEQKRRDVKILNVQFKIISYSTENLSALVEIKSSTRKWHALRLFTSTVLYSPILGDNIYGSRTQNVMGKWINVSPFVEAAQLPPRLDEELLKLLKISRGKEELIPTHLHLREVFLPMYPKKDSDLVLTAPPMPEFTWTCQQLKFKHELFKEDDEDDWEEKDVSEPERCQAVT